jgi:hypothetical protein
MAKAINPKGISSAGQNGSPPKTACKGEGINRKEVTNVPGGTAPRNTRSPGPSGKGLKKGRKPTGKDPVKSSKLNISTPGGGIKVKSNKTGRSPRGRKGGASAV